MAKDCPLNTTDYEGGSGAGKALPTKSHGEGSFDAGGGAKPHPGENDRYGGKDYSARLSRAQKKS